MKIKLFLFPGLAMFAGIMLFSCSNKTEEFITDKMSDYVPLQPGKYITYRLDSLIYTNFGTIAQVHRYQSKHVIDAQITDNQGRPSYRVYTYIRDSAGTEPWTANATYFITPLADQLELIEDNFRVIKLHLPIKEGFQWKGNSHLAFHPYSPAYNFINDGDIQDWDFTYGPVEPSFTYQGNTYKDVLTVAQVDDKTNAPVTNPNSIGYESLSLEKYSKGIGLVFRKHVLWDYQISPTQHYTGFGVTMWMIDHN
jgi:hypothetical protein